LPHINDAGLALIESFEGDSLRSYPDPGSGGNPWTIGYGHTAKVHPGQVITQAQAIAFLKADVANAESAVSHACEVNLTPNQFSALVSFEYNTGAFGSGEPIVKCINAKDWAAAMNHLNRYVFPPAATVGLTRRRAAETKLFNT
jgi:lysozyme